MRQHDVFEALAGAVMLGEATAAERALFEDHARACAACRDDVGFAAGTMHEIEDSRDSEIWRPSVATPVLERIARTRGRRRERTIGAFGWAIALSLVVNVAFASGITSGTFSSFRPTVEATSDVSATTIHFEKARVRPVAAHVAEPATLERAVVARARVPHATHGGPRRVARTSPKARSIVTAAVAASDGAPLAIRSADATEAVPPRFDEPDILVGLEIERGDPSGRIPDAARESRRVAIEPAGCERRSERDTSRDVPDACVATAAPPAR